MEIQGNIVQINPEQSGEGKNGTWRKQEFIIESNTESKYPKKVCITMWGDKIDQFALSEGESVKVAIDIESREYNGRWYTDVKAWKVEKEGADQQPSAMEEGIDIPPGPAEPAEPKGEDMEDLPF
ncbi:MAG: DUF3127 domain-containing protein [Bacteroidetes bacterium]|nr:DUF3127 domain-containing protein [Bacteroidota bacterium]